MTGDFNTGVGFAALWYNETGDYNTGLGCDASPINNYSNTTGVGYNADLPSKIIRSAWETVL
ncbi:MAG: hypothetical protein R2764_22420 [Bacteroidales bacterium]